MNIASKHVVNRARTIAAGENIEQEEEHLRKVLRDNGYQGYILNM